MRADLSVCCFLVQANQSRGLGRFSTGQVRGSCLCYGQITLWWERHFDDDDMILRCLPVSAKCNTAGCVTSALKATVLNHHKLNSNFGLITTGRANKYFRLCRPYGLSHSYSTLRF